MRSEPHWISVALAIAIHEHLLAEHGGASGIRDQGALESALASPVNRFHHGETDIVSLAAGYAHAISRNHPFVDGNKRIALVTAITFLELNGYRFSGSQAEAAERTLAFAAQEIGEGEFREWLQQNSRVN